MKKFVKMSETEKRILKMKVTDFLTYVNELENNLEMYKVLYVKVCNDVIHHFGESLKYQNALDKACKELSKQEICPIAMNNGWLSNCDRCKEDYKKCWKEWCLEYE